MHRHESSTMRGTRAAISLNRIDFSTWSRPHFLRSLRFCAKTAVEIKNSSKTPVISRRWKSVELVCGRECAFHSIRFVGIDNVDERRSSTSSRDYKRFRNTFSCGELLQCRLNHIDDASHFAMFTLACETTNCHFVLTVVTALHAPVSLFYDFVKLCFQWGTTLCLLCTRVATFSIVLR